MSPRRCRRSSPRRRGEGRSRHRQGRSVAVAQGPGRRSPRSSPTPAIRRGRRLSARQTRARHAPTSTRSLAGKTLFITGASRGIGLAIAHARGARRRQCRHRRQERDGKPEASRHDLHRRGGDRGGRRAGARPSLRHSLRRSGRGGDRQDGRHLRRRRHSRQQRQRHRSARRSTSSR